MTGRPAIVTAKLRRVAEGSVMFAKRLESAAEKEAEATGDQTAARRARAAREFAAFVEEVAAAQGNVAAVEGVEYRS